MAGIDNITKLLLNCNGADSSIVFTDSSNFTHTVTSVGDSQIDTSQSVFGGSSGLFDASGDWLSIPDSPDWNLGAYDFTIDFRVRLNGSVTSTGFCGQSNGPSNNLKWGLYWDSITSGNITFHMQNPSGVSHNVNFLWTPLADTWYHLALVREGNNWLFFVNGVQTGGTQVEVSAVPDVTSDLRIGADGENFGLLNGWLDEFRISKGSARWTSNFTPPIESYAPGEPFLSGYINRKKITIDNTKIDSIQTDFELRVALTNGNFDFTKAESNGFDIIFTSSDGNTLITFERSSYNNIGQLGEFHVKVPYVSNVADTEIYMYYGNNSALDTSDPNNVWSSDYKAVYHMGDATTTTVVDSTVNGNTANKDVANNPLEVDSDFGKGQYFNGLDSIVTVPSSASVDISNPSTWTIWFKWDGVNGQSQDLITKWRNPYDLKITIDDSASGGGNFRMAWSAGFQGTGFSPTYLNDGLLHVCDVVVGGGQTKIYIDNILKETIAGTPGSGSGFDIGNEAGTIHEFNGTMSEIRLSNIEKSDAYRKVSLNSGLDTLVIFGLEEQDTTLVLSDIDTDIRVVREQLEDINTDIRINFESVLDDISTDIRSISPLVLKDINTDIRINFERVLDDISTDIRVKPIANFEDINTDIRTIKPILQEINTDIRVAHVIDSSQVLVNSIIVSEEYYLCENSGTINLELDVDNAVNFKFKREDEVNYSSFEAYSITKLLTLSAGDGIKYFDIIFQDILGIESLPQRMEVFIDSSTPTGVVIEAFSDDTLSTTILDSVYTNYNNPFFRFEVPVFTIPYDGFSYALDGEPGDDENVGVGDLVTNGLEVTKATPLPEMTLDISAGTVYLTGTIVAIGAGSVLISDGGSLDRIDLIYIDEDNNIVVLEGTESLTPESPSLSDDFLELATVLVPANETLVSNITTTDIRRTHIEIIDFIGNNLVSGNHEFKVKAISSCGNFSDVTTFNLYISNSSPEMGEILTYVDNSKLFEITNGICQSLTNTPYLEWSVAPSEPGPITYYYTTDGLDPTVGSTSTTNNYVTLGTLAEGFTNIKVLPVDDTTGNVGTIKEFSLVYCTATLTGDTIVICNGNTLKQSLKQIQVRQIDWDFDSARLCKIFQPVEFDSNLPFNLNDNITVMHNGDTVFTGKVKVISRTLSIGGEGVEYACVGPRGSLTECYATYNDPDFGDTAVIKFEDKPLTEALTQIINLATNTIKGVESLPTGANVFDAFQGQSIEQVLSSLYSGTKYGWYLKPSGKLVSVSKNVINPKLAKFGVYGSTVSSTNPQYNVMSSNLRFDSSKRYNKAIIEGSRRKEFKKVSAACKGSDFNTYYINSDFPVVKVIKTNVSFRKALGGFISFVHPGGISNLPIIASLYHFLRLDVCKNNEITQIRNKLSKQGYLMPVANTVSEFPQGSLGSNNTISFSKPAFNLWWYRSQQSKSLTSIEIPLGQDASKFCASVSAEVLVETSPLRVEVSVSGTADAFAKTMRIVNTSFRYTEDPDDPIDDTAQMIEYAQDTLEKLKDIKVNGSIVLDTVDSSWTLDNSVNLINTEQGSWTSLNVKVVGISFDFDENTTTLELTSEFLI